MPDQPDETPRRRDRVRAAALRAAPYVGVAVGVGVVAYARRNTTFALLGGQGMSARRALPSGAPALQASTPHLSLVPDLPVAEAVSISTRKSPVMHVVDGYVRGETNVRPHLSPAPTRGGTRLTVDQVLEHLNAVAA